MPHLRIASHLFSHTPIASCQTIQHPSAPILLALIKLLVLKVLFFPVVSLNEWVISSVGKRKAIMLAELAIDRRHLTFAFDFGLLAHLSIIEQDIHHKRSIG